MACNLARSFVYDATVLRVVLLVLSLLACSSPPPPTQQPTTGKRAITPRTKLPAAIQPLLPARGVYIAGGGLVSSAWRVVVDLDKKTIYGGSAKGSNAPSMGRMDKEDTKELSSRNEQHLMKIAEDVWREIPPQAPVDPTADYDEIFVILDGDNAFFLQGYGPIRRPIAAKAIIEFRAAAGL
jgi:hypothetical protein